MTVLELVEQAAERLAQAQVAFGHGTDNAFDEAAWLVLWRLGRPLDALEAQAGDRVTEAEVAAVRALIDERIRSRRPAAHLTGEAWLQGVPFTVDERTIVPRSLIAEVLADGTLEAWLPSPPRRVLDLCTGNGSLAVLAALAWPEAEVLGTDLSAAALEVARLNVARHRLEGRVRLAQGDAWAAAPGVFDLVLCNPPYVNHGSMQALPPEYRAEPALALDGGADGMDFVRRLFSGLAAHLAPAGCLVLEIGHEREHFEAAFPRLPLIWLPTHAGDDQVLLVERAALP